MDRQRLCDFHGRNRKPQIELARRFGFSEWSQPAGGCCFLTNKDYSDKLADLWRARGKRDYDLDDILLLKVGRHLRPAPHFKLIVAREEGENNYLRGYRNEFVSLAPTSHKGPLALLDGEPSATDLELAAAIVARYSQGRQEPAVSVEIRHPDGVAQQISVRPLSAQEIEPNWHIAHG